MTPKKAFLRHTHQKHILQKKWSQTAICGLSSGQTILPQPIWVHSLQLDDRHRNPNINIREIIWLGNQLPKTQRWKKRQTLQTCLCYFSQLLLIFRPRARKTMREECFNHCIISTSDISTSDISTNNFFFMLFADFS